MKFVAILLALLMLPLINPALIFDLPLEVAIDKGLFVQQHLLARHVTFGLVPTEQAIDTLADSTFITAAQKAAGFTVPPHAR